MDNMVGDKKIIKSTAPIGVVLENVEPYYELLISEELRGVDVEQLLLDHPDAPGIVVTDEDGETMGVVSRIRFISLLGTAFGRELYLNRRLRHILHKNEDLLGRDIFEDTLPVTEAISKALKRTLEQRFDPIVVQGEAVTRPRIVAMHNLLHQHLEHTEKLNSLLISADREKDEMLAIASHDLKNPLGVIYTMSELLKGGDLDETMRSDFYRGIHSNAKRMLSIITSFIDAARVEGGVMISRPRYFRVVDLMETCLRVHQDSARNKEQQLLVHLDFDPSQELYTDPDHFGSVVDNLVSNAVKYSPKGGAISVHAFCSKRHFILDVQDSGPGISEDDQKNLFGKYTRLTAKPTGDEGSTGLGLYTVKKIMDDLGGEIFLESRMGKGSLFKARLPLPGDCLQG